MKTAIICGRAWSTYLSRALMRSGLLRHWLPVRPADKWDTQPDVQFDIRDRWPAITAGDLQHDAAASMNAQGLAEWDVVKCPEFSLVVPQLREAYPGIRFIVIDRDLEARVRSSMNVNSTGWIMKSIARNAILRDRIENTLDIKPGVLIDDPGMYEQDKTRRDRVQEEVHVRAWWLFLDVMRERALFDVPPADVLRLSYDLCQREFEVAIGTIAKFLCHPVVSIDPDTGDAVTWLDQWRAMRSEALQWSAHEPGYWLKEDG